MAGWQDGHGDWADLEYDDEEMGEHMMPPMPSPPQYPYGTRICLTGRELEMLRLPLPTVGNLIDLRAFAEVTSVSDDGQCQRVELQITKLKVENEDDEGGEDED
jgi:hypothetical protein